MKAITQCCTSGQFCGVFWRYCYFIMSKAGFPDSAGSLTWMENYVIQTAFIDLVLASKMKQTDSWHYACLTRKCFIANQPKEQLCWSSGLSVHIVSPLLAAATVWKSLFSRAPNKSPLTTHLTKSWTKIGILWN